MVVIYQKGTIEILQYLSNQQRWSWADDLQALCDLQENKGRGKPSSTNDIKVTWPPGTRWCRFRIWHNDWLLHCLYSVGVKEILSSFEISSYLLFMYNRNCGIILLDISPLILFALFSWINTIIYSMKLSKNSAF